MHRAASRSRRQLPPRQKPKQSRNPEPLYPGRDGNRGGQRHRRGWKGVLHHHHSRRERVLSGDRQTETSENVYFLNTVTTDDLLPLAEQGKEPPKEVTPEPEPKPTEPVEEVPEPKPEKKDSPLLSLLLIGAVVLAGGGIGYYFKIYKPKHEAPDLEDDYCEYEDGELEEIAEEPEDEDTPPWEEDTEE